MEHDMSTAEEGRATVRGEVLWPDMGHARYGAAGVGSEVSARRQQDRVGVIVGGIAIVAMVLGLAEVAEMGSHESGAIGRGSRLRPSLTSSLARRQPSRIREVLGQNMQAMAETDAVDTGSNSTPPIECCPCPTATTAGQDLQGNVPVLTGSTQETPSNTSSGNASSRAMAPIAALGTQSETSHLLTQVAAKVRREVTLQQGRKLLQEDENRSAVAPTSSVAGGDVTEQEDSACCPCQVGPRRRAVQQQNDWSPDAMPHNAWDDALSALKYVGKGFWWVGYEDVFKENGERMVPKPILPEHNVPWIGPRDIVVPSLEFEGTEHNSGWIIPSSIFGHGKPKGRRGGTEMQDVINSYTSDMMVDQRITHMGDPGNAHGRQLPGVIVDWSRIPHPAEASKQGGRTFFRNASCFLSIAIADALRNDCAACLQCLVLTSWYRPHDAACDAMQGRQPSMLRILSTMRTARSNTRRILQIPLFLTEAPCVR